MARPIFDLCDEYVTRAALLDPVWATMRGIGGSVGAATDFGPEGVAARAELIGEMLRRLARLEPSTEEDRAAADFLGDRLGAERDWYDSGEPLRLVRAPFGPIGTIRDSVDLLPRDSEEAWRAVTARLSAVPVMLASWRAALAVGLQRGLVGARRQAVESAAQADRYVGLDDAPPTHDAVVEAYGEGPLRAELAGAARAAHAAYAETARHLREEYAPRATEADGVGAERHALARRLVLGADIDPIEAYDWGWAELRRIEEEVAAEADRVRPDASLAEAVAVLDETEYVEGADAYREWLQEQHDRAIEQLHGVHFDIAAPLRRVGVLHSAERGLHAPGPHLVAAGRPGQVRGVERADHGIPRGGTRTPPAARSGSGGGRAAVAVQPGLRGVGACRRLGAARGASRHRHRVAPRPATAGGRGGAPRSTMDI